MTQNEQSDIFKAVFEQNFLHERQAVTERNWFTNVYVIVVSGVMTFLSRTNDDRFYSPIFLSLLTFSIIGFLINLKLGVEVTNIFKEIEKLVNSYFNEEEAKRLKECIAFPVKGKRHDIMRLRYLYPLIYSTTAGIWFTLLLNPSAKDPIQFFIPVLIGGLLGIALEIIYFDP